MRGQKRSPIRQQEFPCRTPFRVATPGAFRLVGKQLANIEGLMLEATATLSLIAFGTSVPFASRQLVVQAHGPKGTLWLEHGCAFRIHTAEAGYRQADGVLAAHPNIPR